MAKKKTKPNNELFLVTDTSETNYDLETARSEAESLVNEGRGTQFIYKLIEVVRRASGTETKTAEEYGKEEGVFDAD